jgi:hypothetical protein
MVVVALEEMVAVEMEAAVEIQEETVAKEIVVQEDQTMEVDTEDQVQDHKENLLVMQVIKVEQKDQVIQDQEIVVQEWVE